jgi:hypothetical protein
MTWYDMVYDTWYMICWYDMIYLTTIGLPAGDIIRANIYTQTVHRITQSTENNTQNNTIH